jgi:phosphotransferase system  glucose/maltose/N-acetylglucosamine-specific IIC component
MSHDQQFSAPPAPQGAYPGAPQPEPGRSGLAVAGLILAIFIAPIGFILSLIAVFTTGKGKAKGRGMAIAGLIISTLIIGGLIALVLAVSNSTVADPGCTSGKQVILDSAASGDPASLQKTIDGLNAAAAKAKHADVRDAMKTLADDYTQVLNATKTGKMPDGLLDKIGADGTKIDSLCTIGS